MVTLNKRTRRWYGTAAPAVGTVIVWQPGCPYDETLALVTVLQRTGRKLHALGTVGDNTYKVVVEAPHD